MTPPETLRRRVLEQVLQHPAPRRAGSAPATAALAVLAVLAMAAVLLWAPRLFGDAGGLARAAGRPAASGAAILGGALALAVAATSLVLPSRRSMLAPPRGVLLAVVVGVPALLGAWLALWHASYADPFAGVGWRCFVLTALSAPWPFVVLARVARRVEPRHPATAGAALGAAAGAWAAALVELWCPLAAHAHVLVGHVLPVLTLALAGAAVGVRLFRLPRLPRHPESMS